MIPPSPVGPSASALSSAGLANGVNRVATEVSSFRRSSSQSGVAPGQAMSAPRVRPPHSIPESKAHETQTKAAGIQTLPNELLIEVLNHLPASSIKAVHQTSQRFHSRMVAELYANASFDFALRIQPLDGQRLADLLNGAAPFAYKRLSAASQRARVADVVRAAMRAPAPQREAVLNRTRFHLLALCTATTSEEVSLRAARGVTLPRDVPIVLGRNGEHLAGSSTQQVRQLLTVLVGRVALASLDRTRTGMLDHIRRANDLLGDKSLPDIEALIENCPPDGTIPQDCTDAIREFRVRANDDNDMPSPRDILAHKQLYGVVRQISALAYWLRCQGQSDLRGFLKLSKAERWFLIEDYAVDMGIDQSPDEIERHVSQVAEKLKPIHSAQELASELGADLRHFLRGSTARRQELLRTLGSHVGAMKDIENAQAMVHLGRANAALPIGDRIDIEEYRRA